jgi:hypothetical protein
MRAAHARVGPREDGRELDVLLGEVRVIFSDLLRSSAAQKHSAEVEDAKPALGEGRLAPKDSLGGDDARPLPRLEAGELRLRVFGDPVEVNLQDGDENGHGSGYGQVAKTPQFGATPDA